MRTKYYLAIATAAALLAACTNDENVTDNGPVEARVTAGMGSTTRAVNTDDTWTQNDAIGVMVTNAPTSGTGMTDRYKNVKYTAKSTGSPADFEATDGIFFQDATETVTFAAYYPYKESGASELPGTSSDGVITGSTQENNTGSNQANIDFLFASGATATKSSPTVTFAESNAFQHKMAQLKLVIQASTTDGFTEEEAKGIFADAAETYKLGGLTHEGTFNVTNGATTTTGSIVSNWDITGCRHDDEQETSPYTRTYTLILFPQDKSSNALTFSATIGGQTYTTGTDASKAIMPNLEAGKSYTYTITVKKAGLTVSGCAIEPWSPQKGVDVDATM